MRKIRIGLIFGGRSGEHEVSLMSAKSIIQSLSKERYEIIPIGITKKGRWVFAGEALAMLGDESLPKQTLVLTRDPGLGEFPPLDFTYFSKNVDVIFPILHGPHGEDGTLQGFLELANIAYVGAGVLGSAVSMDKAMMRVVLEQAGLPLTKWIKVIKSQWEEKPEAVIDLVQTKIGYPCFVKPSNLGSSVGISKAGTQEDLINAINLASQFDRRIIIEEAVDKPREIECSVLGNDNPVPSVPGEIIPGSEFYDYEDKYHSNKARLIIPAVLEPKQVKTIQKYAVKTFEAVDCAGMARVDFFITQKDEILVNEINTIPGFTHISMYPKLWEASGVEYGRLLDELIQLALQRHQERLSRRISF